MSTVIYVAIVEGNQDAGYAAFFPDLPGCVTAAETMVELPAAARDALSLHLQGMAEDGDAFPAATALEDIKGDPEVKEIGRMLVDADVEDAPVRVNISIGAQFLKRVDVAAEARGMSRSGFLIEGARALMEPRAVATHFDAFREQLVERMEALDHDVGVMIDAGAAKHFSEIVPAEIKQHGKVPAYYMFKPILTDSMYAKGCVITGGAKHPIRKLPRHIRSWK